MVLCEHWKDWEWLRGRQIGFMGTKYSKKGKLESQAVSRIRDLLKYRSRLSSSS